MEGQNNQQPQQQSAPTLQNPSSRLSYKFQRLRERLRQAILTGQLAGKLPGERILAKQFNANAKTLSKALTDLAGEGLLDRSIGRGTYVRGSQPQPAKSGKLLILCDPGQQNSLAVQRILRDRPEAEIATDVGHIRPSFINQFDSVIDLASNTPENFLRDLLVRNISVVAIGREPRTYSISTVTMDPAFGLNKLARELLSAGHRHFAAVEARGSTIVSQTLRQAASHYNPPSTVDAFLPGEVAHVVDAGITAVFCDSVATAQSVTEAFRRLNIPFPGRLSVAAVGLSNGAIPCTGFFLNADQAVESALALLNDNQSARRPVTLWLTGSLVDRGTLGPSEAFPSTTQPAIAPRIAGVVV